MAYKSFDISKIRKTDNPFSNTRASSIEDGIFIRGTEIEDNIFIPSTKKAVKIGLINKVEKIYNDIIESSKPRHVLILADYGQGKSFSIKYIQDKIYELRADPIISYSIGINYEDIVAEKDFFIKSIIHNLKKAFDNVNIEIYPDKDTIKVKHKLDNPRRMKNLLRSFDTAFSELQIRVYIFIDELDKVVTNPKLDDAQKKYFLESLKSIAEECENSISLWVAGTKPCQEKIDELGLDYNPRFKIILNNLFNRNETINYIDEKCMPILKFKGCIPFNKFVKVGVYNLSDGNIRYIEDICWDLWNFSVDKKRKLDNKLFEEFLGGKLYEPIKAVLGSGIDDHVILFISRLVINREINVKTAFKKIKKRKTEDIKRYIKTNPEVVTKLDRYYKIDAKLKDKIIKEMLGII